MNACYHFSTFGEEAHGPIFHHEEDLLGLLLLECPNAEVGK